MTNFEKLQSVIKGWTPEKREQSGSIVNAELVPMNAAIRAMVEPAAADGDGLRLLCLHIQLKSWMAEIERVVNCAPSMVETVEDGIVELTKEDGEVISARRRIKREV
jgi:hypothetical protein